MTRVPATTSYLNVSSLLYVLVDMLILSETVRGEPADDADAAIRQLYALHALALRRYVERFCPDRTSADDIVQETFIRAWRHLPQLASGDVPVRPWLPCDSSRTTSAPSR